MPINKVVYNQRTLIDLTSDTVTEETLKHGFTAHKADGSLIVGRLTQEDSDEIDRILTSGLTDGYKNFSSNGKIIKTKDSKGRILQKTFSDDFATCTTVLLSESGEELGRTVKQFQKDGRSITTTDSHGQTLTKIFSIHLKKVTLRLKNKSGKELAVLTKTYQNNFKAIKSRLSPSE